MQTLLIQVQLRSGPAEAVAYETGVPGLVVHRAQGNNPLAWVVTHQGSGRAVLKKNLPRKRDALRAAEALRDVADWTLPAEELNTVSIRHALLDALKGARAA